MLETDGAEGSGGCLLGFVGGVHMFFRGPVSHEVPHHHMSVRFRMVHKLWGPT